MAEIRSRRASADTQLVALAESYRWILERYETIERLAREERSELANGEPMSNVIQVLSQKKEILSEIRVEEERMQGAREWWKKTRQNLPSASCRDLLSLLDAISRRVESILALEAECRQLMTQTLSFGTQAPMGSPGTASLAYARTTVSTGEVR